MATESPIRRSLIHGTLTIAMSLAIAGTIVEVGVRFVADDGVQYDLEMWKYAKAVKQVSSSPTLGHEHVPNASALLMGAYVRINSRKLRDREIPYEHTPGVMRIMMLGDSLTFGWGVSLEETTSKRLERLLNVAGIRAEVINAGVGNYNTVMEVEYFLSEGRNYSPDIVVLNYFINDAEPIPSYGHVGWLARHSYAYAYLAGHVDMLMRRLSRKQDWREYYTGLYAEGAAGWAAATERMSTLAQYCASRNVQLVIANYPELRILKNYPFRNIERAIRAEAAQLGVPYLDLYEAVREIEPSKLWVTVSDPHPNGYANSLFAEALRTKILEVVQRFE